MIYQASQDLDYLFPRAVAYRHFLAGGTVQEAAGRYFPYTERHLHALWFDDRLRPGNLKTSHGEPVTVVSPGRWNLEAGPDFQNAVVLLGREQRRVVGDVEIHIFPNDWKHHGHQDDLRYDTVRLHLTWFSDPIDELLFPPGTVHVACGEACAVDLESIDLAAYPYAEPRARTVFPLAGVDPTDVFQILESAGEERIRQKTLRMAWLIQQRGEAQALYEESAAALGYKNNTGAFRKLTQTVTLASLAQYDRDWYTVYAVLIGMSGLLPNKPAANWPESSKNELRALWDCWWREQHKWEEVEPLDKQEWNLSGVRPLNHPDRRMAALAQWVASGLFRSMGTTRCPDALSFQSLEACFWSMHSSWSAKERPAQLVGSDRAQSIVLNVVAPYRLAKKDGSILTHLLVEPMNSVIRETAATLFGPDHSPKIYKTALARQGLLQIFHDYILAGRLDELTNL